MLSKIPKWIPFATISLTLLGFVFWAGVQYNQTGVNTKEITELNAKVSKTNEELKATNETLQAFHAEYREDIGILMERTKNLNQPERPLASSMSRVSSFTEEATQ